MARVEVHQEVNDGNLGDWHLCFQQCTYHYDDGTTDEGYRFIWRTPEGRLQPARGQARIPNAAALRALIDQAETAGWLA